MLYHTKYNKLFLLLLEIYLYDMFTIFVAQVQYLC